MIDPANIKQVPMNTTDMKLHMENIPEYDLEVYDIYDEKSFKKYMSDLEKNVRTSFEYRRLIKYLHENMDMNRCMFLKEYNDEGNQLDYKIEIHHNTFTLYDICLIVFNKRLFYHESLELQMVAKEVMMLHYSIFVGLVPLSKTAHELTHNHYLFIPIENVFGDYKGFINQYKEFMLPEHLDVIERIEEYSKSFNKYNNEQVLTQKTIELLPKGSYMLPDLNNVFNTMMNRIDAIKQNGYQLPKITEEDKQELLNKEEPKLTSPIYFF